MHAIWWTNLLNIWNLPSYSFIIFFSNSTNNVSCSLLSFDEIITGNVSLSPKNVYLKYEGNGFKSKLGGLTIEGGVCLILVGNAWWMNASFCSRDFSPS